MYDTRVGFVMKLLGIVAFLREAIRAQHTGEKRYAQAAAGKAEAIVVAMEDFDWSMGDGADHFAFCIREGFQREQDVLPGRLMEDPLPDGPAQGMVNDRETMEMMKDAYYGLRGWDSATGTPTPEKLQELALDELVSDLWGR